MLFRSEGVREKRSGITGWVWKRMAFDSERYDYDHDMRFLYSNLKTSNLAHKIVICLEAGYAAIKVKSRQSLEIAN